ncbi:TolC family protein [Flavobacterium caeni]|uniref:Outer membrane protein TolC n=1 Tax=Flavobacterium caeni TaxID=490189 RepID=A0A1G5AR78_9FLAO|nr:TolC family protein [Flavobacterium caeni]SCX80361.1 Outer membrane protein TolC [Flavobacterium caeni]
MKFKIFVSVLALGFSFLADAQEILTIEDAVKIALENNYDIRISANELKVDQTNATIGNAGMLPQLAANVVDNNGIQYSSQTRNDGTVNRLDNARNNSLSYGVGLNWTIFDGFGMFARYNQLKEIEKLGETEYRLMVQTRVGDVMTAYYDLVQQQQQLKALDTTLIISRERVELAQNRFTIGKASKLEVLNAQVDLNTDETNLVRQKELYANTKTRLNELLARDTALNFTVSESVAVDDKLQLGELTALAEKQNPELQAQLINKRIAELSLKNTRATRYPTIGVSTGYNIVESESSLGFTSQAYSRGWTYGFNATINLFDGLNQNRLEKVAKLQVENQDYLIAQQNLTLKSQLTTAYQTYLTNIELTKLEGKNEEIAEQNLQITLDKFRIGTITTLEFRAAQLNYINAKVRNSNAQFQAKLSEVALKQLAGNLSF